MAYTEDELNAIYERTSGKCHICRKKLALRNYATRGSRGAWEVEHSRPRARGGTNHRNNLFGAHIPCNRKKGTKSTRAARAAHGYRRAPLSRSKREAVRKGNAADGALIGAFVGAALGPGWVIGAMIGAVLGHDLDPDDA